MKRLVLKSKLKKVFITSRERDYEGSVTMCPTLMKAANLIPYERVEVNSVNRSGRIVTYVIPGNDREIGVRGGAASFFRKGEAVHINCYTIIDNGEVFTPAIVETDDKNNLIRISEQGKAF